MIRTCEIKHGDKDVTIISATPFIDRFAAELKITPESLLAILSTLYPIAKLIMYQNELFFITEEVQLRRAAELWVEHNIFKVACPDIEKAIRIQKINSLIETMPIQE